MIICRLVSLIVSGCLSLGLVPDAQAFDLVPGDLYSSNYGSLVISRYAPDGAFIDSIAIPSNYGSEVRGLAVGPDNLLYATTVEGSGFNVIAIDRSGAVQSTYNGQTYVAGNLSSGKIAFSRNGQFFVAGGDYLTRFDVGTTYGTYVYTNNGVMDVKELPSGNLLVLSDYQLDEITTEGVLVRTITPSPVFLVDARGLEYDPVSKTIYVSMLGYSGEDFQVLRLRLSGQIIQSTYFIYADDLLLTPDRHFGPGTSRPGPLWPAPRLIVGSRVQTPGVFDLALHQTGVLDGDQQMFVTQMQ
jgi:hypothetical protein